MTNNLRIAMIIFAFVIVTITIISLKNKKIPIKYSLVWFGASFVILLLSIFPDIFTFIARILGFNMMSNMIIAIFIGVLLIITMVLTMIVSNQNKKIIMLIQEISILKNDRKDKNER